MKSNDTTVVVLIATILIFLGLMGFSGWGMMGYGYGMMSWFSSPFFFFNWIICILIIIALVILIAWLFKQFTRDERRRK